MQNVIMKRGLRAHEKERYMRVDMLNSDRRSSPSLHGRTSPFLFPFVPLIAWLL